MMRSCGVRAMVGFLAISLRLATATAAEGDPGEGAPVPDAPAAAEAAPANAADEARKVFDSLYGHQVKTALRTPESDDDVALARQLMSAAQKSAASPALQVVLCQQAAVLGARGNDGLAVAVEALGLLIELEPESKLPRLEKIFDYQRRMVSGSRPPERDRMAGRMAGTALELADAKAEAGQVSEALAMVRTALGLVGTVEVRRREQLTRKVRELTERQQVQSAIDQWRAKERANPRDPLPHRQLLEIYLVQLDDPAKAAAHAGPAGDAAAERFMALATGAAKPSAQGDWIDLGEWYLALANKHEKYKPTMLARAQRYLRQFLDTYGEADLSRARAEVLMSQVQQSLAALEEEQEKQRAPDPSAWVDLLKVINPDKNAFEGKWTKDEDSLNVVQASAYARLTIPYVPKGDYDLHITLRRTSGAGQFGVGLPVGSANVGLGISGLSGTGLANIWGEDGSVNSTNARDVHVQSNRDYNLDVSVRVKGTSASIIVRLDQKQVIKWAGPLRALSVPASARPTIRGAILLGVTNSTAQFSDIRVRAAPVEEN